MKPASIELQTHLQQEVTTLATCWKVTRTDGQVMAFTSLDVDIIFDSVTYISVVGITLTSIEGRDNMAVPNSDVAGILHENYISAPDIAAGLYDFAEVEIFKVNYEDLSQGRILEQRGTIGEIRTQKNGFVAELRGLSQQLQQSVGKIYSSTCRADLGDSKCKVALGGFTVSASVTAITNNAIFSASALTQNAGWFTEGKITWTSGYNSGFTQDIKEFSNTIVVLSEAMPFSIVIGDSFDIVAGCDKTFETCKAKFNNAVNFRGEPHVPGTDAILKTAGTI